MNARLLGLPTVVPHQVGSMWTTFRVVCPVQLEDGRVLPCHFRSDVTYEQLHPKEFVPGRLVSIIGDAEFGHVLFGQLTAVEGIPHPAGSPA